MRILLIHQYFLEKGDAGGSRFNEMTQVWASQGHDITVLAGIVHYATGKKPNRYKGKFTHKDEQFYDKVDVVRCHVSESYNVSFLGRLWAYFSFVFSSIYAGIFKTKGKFDFILVSSPPLFVGITAYVLSKLKRIPFVFEVRDLWPESAIDTGILKNGMIIKFAYWFEKILYKKAKLINVLTPAFRDKLIQSKKVPAEKIIFIPNAADFSLAEKIQKNFDAVAFKKELGLDDKFVCFWNNRNARRKQSGTLIYWFKEFLDKVGHDKATLIMHTDVKDVHGQDLEAIIQELGLTNGEILFSRAKVNATDLAMVYNMADLTINISDAEGFGLATLESLSSGTPILVNMTGGLQDQVTDGENWFGIGLEPASKAIIGSQDVPYIYEDRLGKDQVVNALIELYEMGAEGRANLGNLGREWVKKQFNFETFTQRWDELFTRIHDEKGSWNDRTGYSAYEVREF